MFELDQEQSWVDAKLNEVIFLATSVNRPAVAPPDRSPEMAQAYICTTMQGNLFFVYIYLHLVTSNVGLLYRWDAGGVPRELVPTLEKNALEFTETMGFMMSDLRVRAMGPDERQGIFESSPLFHKDLSRFSTEEEVQEIEPEEIEDSDLVIEPIEEPGTETVTEGDFVLDEEQIPQSSAESPESEEIEDIEEIFLEGVVEETPEPQGAPTAPTAPTAPAEVADEDVLLDNLEITENQPQAVAPSPAPAPPSPMEPVQAEEIISEGEQLLDALEAQDTGEPVAAPSVITPEPPPEPVAQAQPEPSPPPPSEQTEEITIEGMIEEDVEVSDETQEMDIPAAAIIPEQEAPAPAPVPRQVIPQAPVPPEPTSDNLGPDDIKVLVRLLTMM